MTEEDLSPLIDLIYQAGLEPERWDDALRLMIAKFNGTATLYIQDPDTAEAGFLAHVGMDAKFMTDYMEYYGAINPALGLFKTVAEGEIIDIAKITDEETFRRGEFYNDFFRPMDVYHAIGSIVIRGPMAGTNLALQRPLRAGTYTERERAVFTMLTRHVRRSIEVSRRLTAAGWAMEAAASPMRSPTGGYVFVDAAARVLLADPMAEAIFRDDNGLCVTEGRLRAARGDIDARLRAGIEAAASTAAGGGVRSGGVLGLPRRRLEGAPLALLICPWHGNPLAFGVPGPAVLIFIEDPARSPRTGAAGAAVLYGLTPAEARLLEAVLEGQRLADHAAAAEIGLATAKSHLQAIFAKTGQRRQADLVRLVMSSAIARWPGA